MHNHLPRRGFQGDCSYCAAHGNVLDGPVPPSHGHRQGLENLGQGAVLGLKWMPGKYVVEANHPAARTIAVKAEGAPALRYLVLWREVADVFSAVHPGQTCV